jgi:hypothetical protein
MRNSSEIRKGSFIRRERHLYRRENFKLNRAALAEWREFQCRTVVRRSSSNVGALELR